MAESGRFSAVPLTDRPPASVSRGAVGAWRFSPAVPVTLGRTVLRVGLVGFAAGVPLMPTNGLKADLTLLSGCLVGLGLYMGWRAGTRFGRSRLDLPLVGFLLALLLATALSPRPFLSFFPSVSRGDGLLVYLVYLLMAWTAARLNDEEARAVLKAVLVGAAIIGAVATAQYYTADPLPWLGFQPVDPGVYFGVLPGGSADHPYFGWRAFGTLGNPIFLGGYTLLLLPLMIGLLLGRGVAPVRRPLLAAGFALVYAALLASASRGALAGLVLAVLVLVLWPPRRPVVWRDVASVAGLAVVVTVLFSVTGPGGQLVDRVSGPVSTDASLRMKLFVWRHILPLIAERPLFGWGFSNLAGRLPGLGSREYFEIFGFALSGIDTAHNETLHMAFSTGLIGLAAYFWIWVTVLGTLLARVRDGGDGRAMGAGLLAGLVGYGLWLQSAWSHVGPANLFWTVVGLSQLAWGTGEASPAGTEEPARAPVPAGPSERSEAAS